MARAIAIRASAERLDRAAKFAGEVFGVVEEEERFTVPRPYFSSWPFSSSYLASSHLCSPRLWGIAFVVMACGAAVLI
jgi:hypothetical protein